MNTVSFKAKVSSEILFWVLNTETRNVASMVEVCQFAGSTRKIDFNKSQFHTTPVDQLKGKLSIIYVLNCCFTLGPSSMHSKVMN